MWASLFYSKAIYHMQPPQQGTTCISNRRRRRKRLQALLNTIPAVASSPLHHHIVSQRRRNFLTLCVCSCCCLLNIKIIIILLIVLQSNNNCIEISSCTQSQEIHGQTPSTTVNRQAESFKAAKPSSPSTERLSNSINRVQTRSNWWGMQFIDQAVCLSVCVLWCHQLAENNKKSCVLLIQISLFAGCWIDSFAFFFSRKFHARILVWVLQLATILLEVSRSTYV